MNGQQARAIKADQKYYGVAVALVAEVEGDAAREGRVKLTFPWFDPTAVTDWCRVAQLYAGNGYGSLWVPEKDDEVLVGFVMGDMREPIVLGGLYNGQDKPPSHRAADRDQKLFRTKAGHQIEFDDKAGTVTIATQSGTTVTLAESKITLKARDIEIVADGGDVTVSGRKIRLN